MSQRLVLTLKYNKQKELKSSVFLQEYHPSDNYFSIFPNFKRSLFICKTKWNYSLPFRKAMYWTCAGPFKNLAIFGHTWLVRQIYFEAYIFMRWFDPLLTNSSLLSCDILFMYLFLQRRLNWVFWLIRVKSIRYWMHEFNRDIMKIFLRWGKTSTLSKLYVCGIV